MLALVIDDGIQPGTADPVHVALVYQTVGIL